MKNYEVWQKQHHEKAGLMALCASAVRQIVADAEIILYGSVARGEETAESDIDLLVLVSQEVTPALRRTVRARLYHVGLQTDRVITSIVRQKSAWHSAPLNYTPLYHAIENEGVRL